MAYILYLIALFGFIIGQLGRVQLGNSIVFQITDLLVFVSVFVWIISFFWQKKLFSQFFHPYTFPIGLFIFVAIFSLLINAQALSSSEFFVSGLYLVRWITYALLFYVVKSQQETAKRQIWRALGILAGLTIILGYGQYIFYPNLKGLYTVGWDDHLYRMFSTVLDPNFAAAIFTLFLFGIMSVLFHKKRLLIRENILWGVFAFLTFGALLLTYSRGGFISFGIGCIVFFSLLRKWKYLIVALLLLGFGIGVLPKNLHSAGVELWRTASIFARTESASQAITIISDHPLLGVGFNSYRYAMNRYQFANGRNWEVSHSGGGTDISMLFVLATTGILGLTAYLFLWFRIVKRVYASFQKTSSLEHKSVALAVLAWIFSLFVNSLFINSLFYPEVLFLLWSGLGLIENTKQ